ncbi:alpha/beta hydrolase family esterase [Roseibium sp.]|uniref:alpha/beta hydrolase family esterase n=1 Tax=Roseibium sp. TaxID=1936156 RepID=UPI003A97DFE7
MFRRLADELGVVFVAVQGIEGTWSFPSAPHKRRDEFAFFDAVLQDLSMRHGVDPDRTMLTGFSSGGFMTWYLACDRPERFGGYAPIAGAFWQPLPPSCAGPVPYLFHVHGTTDAVVPLEGRALGGGRWRQGDVFQSFEIWRRQLPADADSRQWVESGATELRCESWTPAIGSLELCLHDGGHSLRGEWISRAWRRLSQLRNWN